MKKVSMLVFALLLGGAVAKAGGPPASTCRDVNEYVPDVKEQGPTGSYTLIGGGGSVSSAAQTYHYNGNGWIDRVTVYGSVPFSTGVTVLRARIYNVDANGRPTTLIATSANENFYFWEGSQDFYFGNVFISGNFAVAVELVFNTSSSQRFDLNYTGDGEGNGEDLASLAGSFTGFNWSSALTNFSKDGDFYILPRVRNDIQANFSKSATCIAAGGSVAFTNQSNIVTETMFNTASPLYAWDFGDGSAISNASNPTHVYSNPGSYTVSFTTTFQGYGGTTCQSTTTQTISVGLAVASSSVTNVSCYGGDNGSLTVAGSGGTTPYSYNLGGNYNTSGTFSGLEAGTYTIGITDQLGCTSSVNVTVNEPSGIVISTPLTTNSSCGNSDGAISVAATGGSGALSYSLNGGTAQSSGSFTGLESGSYTITVTDANSCSSSTTAVINDAGAPVLTVQTQTNVSCNGGNDGTIVLTATGGTGTLQYSIDGTNFQISGTFNNVSAGVYGVLVKDNAGCTAGTTITISEPPVLANFSATVSNHVSCNGGSDGVITVNLGTGGTGSYSYSIDGTNFQSNPSFSGLSAGTYTILVRDVTSCEVSVTATVTEPTVLSVTATANNVGCFGSYDGSIVATAAGGTSPYTYSIDGEDFQMATNFDELAAGTYHVDVMDANGCTASTNITVGGPSQITASITPTTATCGNTDGGLTVNAAGGNGAPYTYSIDGTNFQSAASFTGLGAGNYFVIVKDVNGCERVFNITINTTTGPSIDTYNATDISCFGGNDGTLVVTQVTGGTGTIEYSVDGSAWQTTANFNGLAAGMHTLAVRDAVGCVSTLTFTLTEPAQIGITSSVNAVSCYGGTDGEITLTPAGGVGVMAYSIDGVNFQSSNVFNVPAGSYTVYVRDAGGCTSSDHVFVTEPDAIEINAGWLNVSCYGASDGAIVVNASGGTGSIEFSLDATNYQTSNVFTPLSGGNYTVFAQDANGCVEGIFVTVNEPSQIGISATVSDVSCAGGDNGVIDLSVNGGTPGYTFHWTNGKNSEDIFNLTAGSYSVLITDANGCTASGSYTVTQPSNPIIVNGTPTAATGPTNTDGAVDITVTGGTAPYSFNWSNGATTEDITGVAPGVYSVEVTDANGCVTTNGFTVSFNVGINSQEVDAAVNMYPNPAVANVSFEVKGYTLEGINVMNLIGQTLMSVQPNAERTTLDVSALPNGIYLIQVKVDGSYATKRLEIVK